MVPFTRLLLYGEAQICCCHHRSSYLSNILSFTQSNSFQFRLLTTEKSNYSPPKLADGSLFATVGPRRGRRTTTEEPVQSIQLNKPSTGRDDNRFKKRPTFRACLFLVFPAATLYLGYWQWNRHKWKTELAKQIRAGVDNAPVEFPIDNLAALDRMEYTKVRIRGTYLYDRQFQVRMRGRFDPEYMAKARAGAHLLGPRNATNDGSHIITPMQLEGTGLVIMVNRGWLPPEKVPAELKAAKGRPPQVVQLNGIVRKPERSSPFVRNEPEKGIWPTKDLGAMGKWCGALPILVDADFASTQPDGPIGGQTNMELRNEHFNYMITWCTLSALMLGMWIMPYV